MKPTIAQAYQDEAYCNLPIINYWSMTKMDNFICL